MKRINQINNEEKSAVMFVNGQGELVNLEAELELAA